MFITITTLIVLFFLIPIRVKVEYVQSKFNISIYVYYFIKVINIDNTKMFKYKNLLNKNDKKQNKSVFDKLDLKLEIIFKIIKLLKFKEIKININCKNLTGDYILNSYLFAIINSVIPCIVTLNIKNINIQRLKYNIDLYNTNSKTNIKCIFSFVLANIITIIVVDTFKYQMFKLIERGKKYVRASY